MDLQRVLHETFVASVEHHEVINSTNDRARQCVVENLELPRLIVADRQTAGRGRGANRWWTGEGSLAMSLVLPADMIASDAGRSSLVSLAVGVAVVETVREWLGRCAGTAGQASSDAQDRTHSTKSAGQPVGGLRRLGLHWPNDVMLDRRKLAGILIEALAARECVVGIGINTNSTAGDAAEALRARVVTLRDVTGEYCDHVDLIVRLLRRLEMWLVRMRRNGDEVACRADELCLQRGQTLTIGMGDEQVTGLCQGIGRDGALLIETADGVKACCSGTMQQEA